MQEGPGQTIPLSWTSLDHRSLSLADSRSILSISAIVSISASSNTTPLMTPESLVLGRAGACWQFACSSAPNLSDTSCTVLDNWFLLLTKSVSWFESPCALGVSSPGWSVSELLTRDSFKVSLAESFDGELTMPYKAFFSISSFSSLHLSFCFFLRSAEVMRWSGAAPGGTSGGCDCMIRGGLDSPKTQ